MQARPDQQGFPASTLNNDSRSASVPTSPSLLKSALFAHGGIGQLPARQAKKLSISASVPTSPSQLKSALPQTSTRRLGVGIPTLTRAAGLFAVAGLKRLSVTTPVVLGSKLAVKRKL